MQEKRQPGFEEPLAAYKDRTELGCQQGEGAALDRTLANEGGHPQGRTSEHHLRGNDEKRRSQDGRRTRWERQNVGGREDEHQGAEGPVSEGAQHIVDRDGCAGAAGEITQDLGKPLSRFGVLIRGWGGSETTRRVGHGRV